jgi:hypothetical protein
MARTVEVSMKAFGIRSRPVLESSIATVNTFGAKQVAPASAGMQPPHHAFKIWSFLLQGAVLAVLLTLLAWISFSDESAGDIEVRFLIVVLLPAAMICEALGLGKLNFLGPSSIPQQALWVAIFVVAYIYGLVLVGGMRTIAWSFKKLFQLLATRGSGK